MGTLVFVVLLVGVVCFVLVLIFQERKHNFRSQEAMYRVAFFNRYKNGDKLQLCDKALFAELQEAGFITSRGTECWVNITHKGLVILTKEEFDARCDLRAKILKLFSVIR